MLINFDMIAEYREDAYDIRILTSVSPRIKKRSKLILKMNQEDRCLILSKRQIKAL